VLGVEAKRSKIGEFSFTFIYQIWGQLPCVDNPFALTHKAILARSGLS